MDDRIGGFVPATSVTFLFGTGERLTLESDVIQRIPYLAAIVSFEGNLKHTHDCILLDESIDFELFSFVIESLSFRWTREIFTRLPKRYNIIHIIDLIGFLRLTPVPVPTLVDVDSTFFTPGPLESGSSSDEQRELVPSVLQDMAVRFGMAIVKQQYDLEQPEAIDQIYWFVMFILGAHKYFGPRLRYHIYRIAEAYFSLVSTSSQRRLQKLVQTLAINTENLMLTESDDDIGPDREIESFTRQRHFNFDFMFGMPRLLSMQEMSVRNRFLLPMRTY